MGYRGQDDPEVGNALGGRLDDIDRRLRSLEERVNPPPNADWVLTEVGDNLHFLWVPTGAIGPVIGSK